MKLSFLALIAVPVVLAGPTKLSSTLNLKLATSPWTALAAKLSSALPTVGVASVLSAADHAGFSVAPPVPPLTKDLRFTAADDKTTGWYPQGATTSADSLATGKVDGVEAVLTSWYDKTSGGPRGVRIGFHNPSTGKYTYALLVEPVPTSSGMASYKAVKGVHAGGIMWYGNHLYVVDTHVGMRVFDMAKILKVTVGSGIGLRGGKYYAHKYKYVIPQIAKYTRTASSTDFRFSYISLDRTSTPDSILVGEYARDSSARIARFDIDYQTRFLHTGKRKDIWKIGKTSIQGGVVVKGKFYFTKSHGENGKSELLTWNGKSSSDIVSEGAILPPGAEDLSYWGAKDQLWCLAEHPTKRKLYAVKASSF